MAIFKNLNPEICREKWCHVFWQLATRIMLGDRVMIVECKELITDLVFWCKITDV